ncbi:N-acetylmuramidase domain-containing protein [Lacrimispora sp. 38-1]|uniref:N-acetylmuramidase domain-containing protein n=1 Tax=Lacrimispora sp. 38-1 TaxID=3125778 RepID=UPI003CEE85D3
MADYDNSRYTYAQVLAGTGYYMIDDKLRYSAGVKTMQGKLNTAGHNCGTPDGKFGNNTDTAVRGFQRSKSLTIDGKAGKATLTALDKAGSGGSASTAAKNLKKKFGSIISSFASKHSIGEDVLGGFILTESSGSGFSGGKLLIRFENHIFLKNVPSASKTFKVENKVHYYYKNGKWNKTHTGKQSSEYEAFNLAIGIDEYYAYYSVSMGLPQIMGFNFKVTGYDSPKAMFNDFGVSEDNQMKGFCTFIANYSNGSLLKACQSRDFTKMGAIYNGDGATYGPKLKSNAADYANA